MKKLVFILAVLFMFSGCRRYGDYGFASGGGSDDYDYSMLQDTPTTPTVPEPGTFTLVAIGTLLVRKLKGKV
jgi:hypothetical protein